LIHPILICEVTNMENFICGQFGHLFTKITYEVRF
jgi:hypothetical protein